MINKVAEQIREQVKGGELPREVACAMCATEGKGCKVHEDCPLMSSGGGILTVAKWVVQQVEEVMKPFMGEVYKAQEKCNRVMQNENRDEDAREEAFSNQGIAKDVFMGAYLYLIEGTKSDK